MDISYLGGGSVKLAGKGITIISDPTAASVADVILLTSGKSVSAGEAMLIDGPGEYEVKGAMITGAPAGDGTAYAVDIDDATVAIVGANTVLGDQQIEALGQIDVLAVDAADASAAAKIVSQLEPKYVIPVGSDTTAFLKEMGAKPEPIAKLKISGKDLPEETTVVVLEATK